MKLFLLISLFLITETNGYSQANLIKNGGFEAELSNWNGDVATISSYVKKTGQNSCSIIQYTGAQWKGIDQKVNIPKNTVAIEISGWIKTDGIEKGKNIWNSGKFDAEILNASGKGIQSESIASLIGTTPWTFYKKIIKVPAKAPTLRIMLALGETNGTLFFDDIQAKALTQEQIDKAQAEENAKNTATLNVVNNNEPDIPNALINGDFENGTTSWRGKESISQNVFKDGRAALMLHSDTFEWTGIDQTVNIPENAKEITISGWLKSDAIKQGKDPWNNGLFNVEFTAIDNKKTGDDQNVAFVTGTTDWAFYSKKLPVPAGAKKYRIMLALGFASGTLYADTITVNFN